MKNWKSLLLGAVIGIILFAIVIFSLGKNFVNKIEENYGDEYVAVKSLLKDSAPAVVQPNYVLAGLTVSPKFQDYLQKQVENGVWNEEYILQVLADDVIPIYNDNLLAIAGLSATEHIDQIIDAKAKADGLVATIKGIYNKVLSSINSLNLDTLVPRIENIINQIKVLIENISNTNYEDIKKILIDKISNSEYAEDINKILKDIMEIVDQVGVSLTELKDTINKTISEILIDKNPNGKVFKDGDVIPGVGTLNEKEAKILNAIDINIYGEYTKKNLISGSIDIKSIEVNFENIGLGINVNSDKLLNDIENKVDGTVSKLIYSSKGSDNGFLSIGVIYYNEIDNS